MTFLGTNGTNSNPFSNNSGESVKDWSIGILSNNAYFSNPRFSFVHNGSEPFVILDNGNAGIGTTSPDSTLSVNGSAHVTGNTFTSGKDTIGGNLAVGGNVHTCGDLFTDAIQSFTPSVSGFTGSPTIQCSYKKVGHTVFVYFSFAGTANADGHIVFGIPKSYTISTFTAVMVEAIVNSVVQYGYCAANGNSIFLIYGVPSFPGSGTYSTAGQFFYETSN